MKRKLITVIAALGFAVTAAGCSIASTTADQVAVHKGGGPIEAPKNKGCVEAGTKHVENDPGDGYFFYPAGQRAYDFNGDKLSDAAPISSVSKDNVPVTIPGQIMFELNTNCTVLTAFHDNIGNRNQAYIDPDTGTSDGWRKMMNLYIGRAADATLDRVAKQYTWRELYSDPAIKDKMNAEINATITTLVKQQTDKAADGDQDFFLNFTALIKQPTPPKELVDSLKLAEASKSAAAATEAKAKADASAAVAAAQAQVAQKQAELTVAQLEAKIKKAEIDAYGGIKSYNDYKAIEKGLNPYQPSYGAPITDTTK